MSCNGIQIRTPLRRDELRSENSNLRRASRLWREKINSSCDNARTATMSSVPPQNLIERAVYQIIACNGGFIEDGELKKQLEHVRDDFIGGDKHLAEIFREINLRERKFSGMEICSVRLYARQSSENSADGGMGWVTYHGIANTEEDISAKEFGSTYDAIELDYFSRLSTRIYREGHLSSNECLTLCPPKYSAVRGQRLLQSFETDGWLDRNDRNYFVLGPRCFMELRGRFEQMRAEEEAHFDENKNRNTGDVQVDQRSVSAMNQPQYIPY